MLESKTFEISYEDYKSFINDFLVNRGYEKQTEEQIDEIIENSGLLYRNDYNIIGFKTQAFIEFFASVEIYHHKRETHYPFLCNQFNDVNWQNTAIFYAGHSKELVGMIDDIIKNSPNENLKDWFINSGGMGYLSQALYQTTPIERKKLVFQALDNLIKVFHEIKSLTKENETNFKDLPLPFAATLVNYWFNENFKSVTLKKTLEVSFNEILKLDNNFENNFKLLMISSTLMNSYIGAEECFAILLERSEFMKHPILPLVADILIEIGNIDDKNLAKERRDKIKKSILKKREYIRAVLKEPAYRFNENFALE